MASKYKLRATPIFNQDLAEIVDYIANILENPQAARRLLVEVEAAIKRRVQHPLDFQPAVFGKRLKQPYYRIRVKRYDIFYVIIDDVMELRRMIYGRRDLKAVIRRSAE